MPFSEQRTKSPHINLRTSRQVVEIGPRPSLIPIFFIFGLLLIGMGIFLHLESGKTHIAGGPNSTANKTQKLTITIPTISNPLPTGLDASFSRQVNECVIPTAAVYGFDLYIVSGFRSFAQENALYAQGRTVDGAVISYAQGGQSFHNFGYAADLGGHQYGENIDYGELGSIAAWCGLEHGDRGYADLPHFEYRDDLSLEEFQAGIRPKELQLPCQLLDQRAKANQALTLADLQSCGAPTFTPTPGYEVGTQQTGVTGQ